MWSQCVWLIRMFPRSGLALDARSASPSPWAPVPQSSTTSVPAAERNSTQDVIPPYLNVPRPALAIEPQVPQKQTCVELLSVMTMPIGPPLSSKKTPQRPRCNSMETARKFLPAALPL